LGVVRFEETAPFGFIISIFFKKKKKIIESFLLIVLCPDILTGG